MKLPGEAMLRFDVEPVTEGGKVDQSRCFLIQTARFKPRGLWGLAYWYAVAPFHHYIFSGMLEGLAREAIASTGSER